MGHNRTPFARVMPAVIAALLFPFAAIAGPCDAHFSFDGDLQDSGGNGYHGLMIGEDGALATAQFVEGKYGQALQLDGTSAMRSFIDLHFDTCPQVTVTAWMQVIDTDRKGHQYVISTGSGSGPGIRVSSANVILNGTANGIIQRDTILANAGWIFVAGVYDYTKGTYTLYSGSRGVDKELGDNVRAPEEAIWVGAFNDGMAGPATGILIDDFRIYGQTLSADELRAIQENAAAPGSETQAATTDETTAALPSCSAHSDCAAGNYCAWDRTCHPESHAPMQALEVMPGTAPVEGFILDEDARFTDEEDTDEPAPPAPASPAPEPPASEPPSGYTFSEDVRPSAVGGNAGASTIPMDFKTESLRIISILGNYLLGTKPVDVEIKSESRTMRATSKARTELQFEVGRAGYSIGAIQVCTNPVNSRIKGLVLQTNVIEENGDFGIYAREQESLDSCILWDETVRCDIGAVATGLVVHTQPSSTKEDKITGLQLLCRRIVPNR